MSGPTDPAEPHFDKGLWGWDLTQWRKLPMLWGYSAIWDENLGGTATGAVWNKSTSAIPAGEVWVLRAVSVRNLTRATAPMTIYIVRASGASVYLDYAANQALGIPMLITGDFPLVTGDRVWIYIGTCQAGDVIHAGVCGYKMSLVE